MKIFSYTLLISIHQGKFEIRGAKFGPIAKAPKNGGGKGFFVQSPMPPSFYRNIIMASGADEARCCA
jgi:hypothetical protein